ncbi:MAG: IS110 family transposase [Candidatus Cloacimonetes bacterium]|nr:IS110 family transposase [Candidatus Cloacimonadota bacterium]
MKNLFVGIDISNEKFDFCMLRREDHAIVKRDVVENTKSSILKWLKTMNINQTVFSMEHTGHYGALLIYLLSQENAEFYVINPLELKNSMGIQRGKTDAVDAYRISAYTITNKHKLSPYSIPTEALRKLKVLMTARERFVKIAVQLKNSLKANIIVSRTLDVKDLIREEKKQIQSITKAITNFEKQMLEIVRSNQDLQVSYERITRVIGVGPITAIKCIAETDNFSKFANGRKFSCHCGLAPFAYQSGSSVKGRTKTHYLRDKSLKSILFKAAGSAIQHDPQLKKYYNRKVKEGKHKLTALNAVANKLVLRIFAVANREEPFVKLSA